jgi:hypothetical protein
MLRLARIPLVKRELVLALCDSQSINGDTGHDCPLAPAKGAVAAAQLLEAVIQIDLELNRAAMATTALGHHGLLQRLLGGELTSPLPLDNVETMTVRITAECRGSMIVLKELFLDGAGGERLL